MDGYDLSTADETGFIIFFTIFLIFIIAVLIVMLIKAILETIAYWKIFSKAEEKGWKALIPIYRKVILFRVSGLSGLWALSYLAVFVPYIGYYVLLVVNTYLMLKLANAFGKSEGFKVGLIFVNPIFMLILAFDKSEHILSNDNKKEVLEISKEVETKEEVQVEE